MDAKREGSSGVNPTLTHSDHVPGLWAVASGFPKLVGRVLHIMSFFFNSGSFELTEYIYPGQETSRVLICQILLQWQVNLLAFLLHSHIYM